MSSDYLFDVDVRQIVLKEGIKVELQKEHARERQLLQEMYIDEGERNGRLVVEVQRLQKKIEELRDDIKFREDEMEMELIETIEEMDAEKHYWRKKYEDLVAVVKNREDDTKPTQLTTDQSVQTEILAEPMEKKKKQKNIVRRLHRSVRRLFSNGVARASMQPTLGKNKLFIFLFLFYKAHCQPAGILVIYQRGLDV